MSDLRLLDDLLCDFKWSRNLTWPEMEKDSNATAAAIRRLRRAWKRREIRSITMSLARYFDGVS